MKTKLVIKSLADIPAEIVSVKAPPADNGKLNAPFANTAPGTPRTVFTVQRTSEPSPSALYDSRDARLFAPQPWPRGGLNE